MNKELFKICKKISALCKNADRVIYDYIQGDGEQDDYIYISEAHTLFKIPAAAEACAVFNDLFDIRRTRGRYGMDHINEGTAARIYNTNFKTADPAAREHSFIQSEKIRKSGSIKGDFYIFEDEKNRDNIRAINARFADIFSGFDTTATGSAKKNMPIYIDCIINGFIIEALLLPFTMDRAAADAAIKASAEAAAEDLKKEKGAYFDNGINSVYIPNGRRDNKTVEKIIKYYAYKKNWAPEIVEKGLKDPANIQAFKDRIINVTAEKIQRDDGRPDYYRFYDKKTFFRSEDLDCCTISDDYGVMYFAAGEERAQIIAARTEAKTAEADPVTDEQEPATTEAIQEPAEAEHVVYTDNGIRPATAAEAAEIERAADFVNGPEDQDPAPVVVDENGPRPATAAEAEYIAKNPIFKDQEPEQGPAEDIPDAAEIDTAAAFWAKISTAPDNNVTAILKAAFTAEAISTAEILDYIDNDVIPIFHTFSGWIGAGYSVKKGEKALFKAEIWEKIRGNFYKRTAAFFAAAQVEPVKARG